MKQYLLTIWCCLCCLVSSVHAQNGDGFGQTIQINTRLSSFVGRPSWLLVIRDIDHGQSIPYVFDFRKGTNYWVALTYGRNYLITASTLQFSPYKRDPYNTKRIHNFCHLESNGRVIRGDSMYITINGYLSPRADSFSCNVARYPGSQLTIAPADTSTEN